MIGDPTFTRIQSILGTGPTGENITLDKVGSTSDGIGSTWRGNSASTAGLRLDVTTKHSVAKNGRRRSLYRVDISYVDSAVSPAVNYTSGAYIVLDSVDIPSAKDIVARNAAISAVLHAFVSAKTISADSTWMAAATDWLNGEP